MFKGFKIDKLRLNNEVWFFAKENKSISKIYFLIIWLGVSIFLYFWDLYLLIPIGFILIPFLPKFYLPFYRKIKPIWGIKNPTRHRSMAMNLIKLRKKQNEKETNSKKY